MGSSDATPIDYDDLKKRGFLRSRHEGLFTLRTRMPAGNYETRHLEAVRSIAGEFGRGLAHLTTRQGIEIPYIRLQDIGKVEERCRQAGILAGTSGPRLRATTSCPGNNWCKRGLVDTFSLFERIEERGIVCALDLPHKFKIAVSGCPNACTRVESSEIGVHGITAAPPGGYAVYVGGCGGRTPHYGFRLRGVYTEADVLDIIEKVVRFFRQNARPRQRLAALIEEMGRDRFLERAGLEEKV
ncbi:MAG: hypothetical protein ACM3L6_05475 [Deltaproteobacteria bacterium]